MRGRGDTGDAVALKSSANFSYREIIFGVLTIINKILFPIIKVLRSFFKSDRVSASSHPRNLITLVFEFRSLSLF
jgi:hypothetical protein